MIQWLKGQGLDLPCVEVEGGTHDLAVWENLPAILDFFERHRRR